MKTRSKSIFNIFTLLILLTMFFGILPTSVAQAESLAAPLYASGDFLWAKSLGGTDFEESDSIAVDSSGNVYTTGYFQGTVDFDPDPGVFNLTSAGLDDIFVSKWDSSGNFVWAKRMGGTGFDYGNGIAVDSSGNVYTTGSFQYTAYFGIFSLTSAGGGNDIFVSKLNSNGNFLWAKRMGGNQTVGDYGYEIAVDSSGNVYTTGSFDGTADFDPNEGTANLTSAGSKDIFVSKLNNSGNFVWAKSMGGVVNYDIGYDITLDSSGNVYITGYFYGTADFDPSAGIFNLTSAGNIDVFVSKLNSSGDFVWAKRMGGTSEDRGYGIAVDSSGNIYTTGSFHVTADFNPDTVTSFPLTSAGGNDIFVSMLDSNGNFAWAKGMGGISDDESNGIAVDSSNNVYTTGYFYGTADFDPGASTGNLASLGSNDIFVSKLDSNGNFDWANSMGGIGAGNGIGIAIDPSGNVYTTGGFSHIADFDPGVGTFNLTSAGGMDTFVSKLEHGEVVPTVASIARASGAANPTSASSADFTVTFSEYVTGVDVSDFSLNTTSDITGASIISVSGSGTTYTVTVNTGTSSNNSTGEPFLRLDVVDDDTIVDSIINKLGGAGLGNGNFTNGQSYIKISVFTDVPFSYWANSYIERLYSAGITSGCGTGIYCPDNTVTRAQMAVFLLKSMHGSSYTPPAVGANTGFTDVATDYWAAAWIKQLAAEGITGGCGNGNYCPDATVTRAQMAIFLLKAKHGSSYSPPTATGVFTDVPVGYWADKWIEQLAVEGVTSGCGAGIYCPDSSVTRAQMAVFLVKAFNLP